MYKWTRTIKSVLFKDQLYFYFVKIMKYLIILINSMKEETMRCEFKKIIFK